MSFDASTLDPAQLAAFRQQAGPIVAQERGLTPACRRKLVGVARSLGIAEEQIDAAVRAISAAEPEAPPNPQAERFRRRLRKDLAGKTKTIIGPTIEEQILAKAAAKYGLDASQAAEVIGDVAAELGLMRITAGEATATLAAQIDEMAKGRTWLAREAWDRLRAAGDRWGIAPEIVEELIEERLAANRLDISKRQWRTNLALAAAGFVAALAIMAAIVYVNRPRTANGPAPVAVPPPLATEPTQPPWWDVPLAVEIAKAHADHGGFGGACDLLASSAADQRAAGYERLVALAAAERARLELQSAAASIAAACLALEPDEAAAGRLQAALVALLPDGEAPLAQAPPLAVSFWAADTVASALARREMSAARKAGLASALSAALGAAFDVDLPADELRRALRAATTLAAYHRLTAAAAKEPPAVAARFDEVSAVSESLPEEDRLRAETALLAAVLPAAGGQWKTYEAALSRCISASDPLPALRLLETYRRIREPQLARQLAELLALRAGVQPKSWSQADVVAAVRKGLGGAAAGAATLSDRWQSLREQVTPALEASAAASTDPRVSLEQTALLAHLTTLAMALAQGDAGLPVFDAAIQQPPQAEQHSDAAAPTPAGKRTSRALSASETRELARLLDALSNRAPARQVPRQSALKALAEMAAVIPDVPPRAAELLAAYLLAEKSPEEATHAQKQAAELRRWLHLRLAVADGLAQAKLPPDQQRELVAALVDELLPAEANLPHALLINVRRELDAAVELRVAASAAGRRDFADAAALQLQQTFLVRARLLGAPVGAIAAAQSPAAALELSLAPLNEGETSDLDNTQQALRYLADSDMQRTAAWQRLGIEAAARRVLRLHPERAAAARQLEIESLAAARAAASVLAQLRDQERTLLQLWMLHAPEL